MWIAREKNGELKVYEHAPYLHSNVRKLVAVYKEEYAPDRWCNIYKPVGDIIEPFWFGLKYYYSMNTLGGYDIASDIFNRGQGHVINSSLFPEITFENSPYNIADLCFLTPEEKEKHIIDNEKKYLE